MTHLHSRPLLVSLLSDVPVSDRAKDALVAMMSTEDRHYHNIDHLTTLWARHCNHAADADFDVEAKRMQLACAIAYHDCVYVGGRSDNEALSAQVWLDVSRDSDLSEADREWVADTIRATKDHLAHWPSGLDPSIPDVGSAQKTKLWMLDLDLTPLGEPPADFDRNTMLLRLEVSHLGDDVYDAARLGFLGRLSNAPVIYRSPSLRAIYEPRARANIARQFI